MTTILASVEHGVIVADSNISDDDRIWTGKKVWRIKGSLIGMAGCDADRAAFLAWFRGGMDGPVEFGTSSALILNSTGLYLFDANYTTPQRLEHGREAIGTGAKAAMCAFEALGWQDPKRAVQIVCKHDAGSRGPVRVYRL